MTTYSFMPLASVTSLGGRMLRHLPVYGLVVALVRYHLRRKVVGGTTESPCLVGDSFCKAKIRDLQMPMPVKE